MSNEKLKSFSQRISGKSDAIKSQELIPAATVVLLRDSPEGMLTLMLRKNSKIAFSGMWVFPGGRIDAEDGPGLDDMEQRARIAAAREAEEETALAVDPSEMVWFSHWTPPDLGNRRFQTWFFAAAAPSADVRIDHGEIIESEWISPRNALAKQRDGEIELAPPTYVTLHYLQEFTSTDHALKSMEGWQPRHYATRIGQLEDDLVAMWEGDAGYESGDADTPGKRHRLSMKSSGFEFDDSGIS